MPSTNLSSTFNLIDAPIRSFNPQTQRTIGNSIIRTLNDQQIEDLFQQRNTPENRDERQGIYNITSAEDPTIPHHAVSERTSQDSLRPVVQQARYLSELTLRIRRLFREFLPLQFSRGGIQRRTQMRQSRNQQNTIQHNVLRSTSDSETTALDSEEERLVLRARQAPRARQNNRRSFTRNRRANRR